ncbi:MAG: hypothetical protein ACTTH0_05975, partial [Eubacteriales bacterium]
DINAQKQYVSVIGRDTENSIEISGDTACIASDYGISGVYNKKLSNLNGISEAGFFVLPGAQNVADKDAQISKNNKNLFEKIGGIDYVEISEGLSITGLGYGHGVGMSQDGAIQMANRGFSYEEILKYYYCDITVD